MPTLDDLLQREPPRTLDDLLVQEPPQPSQYWQTEIASQELPFDPSEPPAISSVEPVQYDLPADPADLPIMTENELARFQREYKPSAVERFAAGAVRAFGIPTKEAGLASGALVPSPEELAEMPWHKKIPETAGSVMVGLTELAAVQGILGSVGVLQKLKPTSSVLAKAWELSKLFGGLGVVEEGKKALLEKGGVDAGYQGATGVFKDMLLGGAISLGLSGVGAVWVKYLKPSELKAAYKVLGVKSNATPKEIKAAARRLALKYHPDKVKGMRAKFEQVMVARETALSKGAVPQDIIYAKQPTRALPPAKGAITKPAKPITPATQPPPAALVAKVPAEGIKVPPVAKEAVTVKPKAGTIAAREAKQVALEAAKHPTQKQFAQGHILAKERGLSDDSYREFAKRVTGKTSMKDMTKEEAAKFISTMSKPVPVKEVKPVVEFTAPERAAIMKSAKTQEVFNRVESYARKLGKAPTDPKLRKSYIKDLRTVALTQKQLQKKQLTKDLRRDEVNVINQWSAARYALGQAEIKSGVPLRSRYSKITTDATASRIKADDIMRKALKNAGVGVWSASMSKNENNLMASWLFEEDRPRRDLFWNQMQPKTQKVAKEMKKILQGTAANEVREARWRLWDVLDKKVRVKIDELSGKKQTSQIKRKIVALESNIDDVQPPNAPNKALAEGREAHSEGKLKEWIATQKWGTRQTYYMSEEALDNLIDLSSELKIATTIEDFATLGTAPSTFLREARTREGAARVKGGSVINATSAHLERLMIFNSTYDSMQDLWEAYGESNPSPSDIKTLNSFLDTALGKGKERNAFVKALQKTTRAFWRFHFFSPAKSAWFVTRNLLQNIAYALSQMSVAEWVKSTPLFYGRKVFKKANPELSEAFRKEWKSKISQKRQMYRQFLLQEEGAVASKFGQRAVIAMDVAGSLATFSDEINRMTVWPVLYTAAQRNVKLFKQGKISFGTLSNRLRLDTLHVSQRLEMKQLLETNPKEFQAKFAEYKTENIHFKYETAFRSAVEQNPLSRIALGLTVYPRGFFELSYQNSIKPMFQGIRIGNGRMFYQGLIGLIFLYAGADVARRLIQKIAGKKAYGFWSNLTQYRPLGPGFGKIKDLMDDWSGIKYRAEENGWNWKRTGEALFSAGSASVEMFIPYCDVMINIYETNNDVYGVRAFRLAKKMAMDKYSKKKGKKFRTADRDTMEKFQHLVFGGAEKPKRQEKKKSSFTRVE